jgi:hypothetical protein
MNYEDLIKQAEINYNTHEELRVIVCATEAIELDKTKIDGYYWRGEAYERTWLHENMLNDADTLLNCTPCTALHFAYRGWAYNVKDKPKQAVDECSKALVQDSSIKTAYYYRAFANIDLGEYDLSIEDCNEIIKLDQKYASAYNLLGFAYEKKNDYDYAIENYDKAIKIDSKSFSARNNRIRAYHNKDKNLSIKLIDIRKNNEYMNKLQENLEKVIPFLGAGASKPYGYYTWDELLNKLFDICCDRYTVNDDIKNQIKYYINNGLYIEAASKMDEIFPNINYTISKVIERIAEANPVKLANMCSILTEYLHLFPNKSCLTTNYDTVIQEIFDIQEKSVKPVYPTSALKELKKLDLTKYYIPSSKENFDKTIYYLHGVYNIPDSITLSKLQYDDYYGADEDIRSNLRRFLPSKLYSIYHNSIFLYIGCGMRIKEDRILKVLREFCRSLPSTDSSYALLNINEIANTEVPYENWKEQSEEVQKKLNAILNEKEDELADMNVCVIWYSTPKTSKDGHESAKRQLLNYILGDEKKRIEKEKKDTIKKETITKMQEIEKIQAELNPEITNLKDNVNEIKLSEEQLKQINEFFKGKINMTEGDTTKCEINFPMYKIDGEKYIIYLLSENGKFYLSDEGTTYKELDKIFELKEPDVKKNLYTILKQYGCYMQRGTYAFIIDCNLKNVHIKMSYLIQAISFMLNMKIFYI